MPNIFISLFFIVSLEAGDTMNLYKGDTKSLYCEFKKDGQTVKVNNAKVRVLHEYNDKVYEDLPWQDMTAFDGGYVYNFDTNVCSNDGKYVIVYKGDYDGETLNVIDEFNIVPQNLEDNNSIYVYGFVNDINSNRIIKNAKIQVISLENNNTVYQTSTDEDGKWEAYIYAGDYEFRFGCKGYEARSVRAQVGDENKEVQFNNIGLEKEADKSLGTGMFKIEDKFTAKNDMGIPNITMEIFTANNLETPIVTTVTDKKGKWKAFLDDGGYIVKITLPSGLTKKFQMNIYNDGSMVMEEIKIKETKVNEPKVDNGNGSEQLVDFVLDAHGNGIPDVSVKAYRYNQETDSYELECKDYTTQEGQFELHLNRGKYKLIVEGNGFLKNEQIINV